MSTQANRHLKSFVDRIQRLKDEQDARAADIREVYAEAKAMGFDKTALGQVVSILRKREKDGEKFEALSATVELYLDALESGTRVATRAHAHETESGSVDAGPVDGTSADRAAPPVPSEEHAPGGVLPPTGDAAHNSNSAPAMVASFQSPSESERAEEGDAETALPASASPAHFTPGTMTAAGQEGGGSVPIEPPSDFDEIRDMPEFCRRFHG